jgi:hypothetical protein
MMMIASVSGSISGCASLNAVRRPTTSFSVFAKKAAKLPWKVPICRNQCPDIETTPFRTP